MSQTKKCAHCFKLLSLDNFYLVNKHGNTVPFSYCKDCEKIRKKQQLMLFKQSCLDYKQCCNCSKCGYNKSIVALDFHHTNPSEKDFCISSCRTLKLNDTIKQELDKCVVLCANCHREEHERTYLQFAPKILSKTIVKTCSDCHYPCSRTSQKCNKCYKKHQRQQSNKPTKKQLLKDIKQLKYFTRIAKEYKVTDNTIRKWCKSYSIL